MHETSLAHHPQKTETKQKYEIVFKYGPEWDILLASFVPEIFSLFYKQLWK